MLSNLIFGDLVFGILNYEQARIYLNSGKAKVYAYYMDVLPPVDMLLGPPPRYKGLGHAGELTYIFDATSYWMYEDTMAGNTPFEWEHDLSSWMQTEWNSIFDTRHPTSQWELFDGAENTLFVREDGKNILKNHQNGLVKALDFWLNTWSPDWGKDL